jgi:hypothetical protein
MKLDAPCSPEDTFQLTVLTLAEVAHTVIKERTDAKKHSRRMYWLDRMLTAIEAINTTYDGYLPEHFQNKGERFHRLIEADMNYLLKGCKTEGEKC